MEKFFKKYHPLVFLGLAILLLYPAFGSGYIFLLDWTVTPEVSWGDIRWQTDPVTTIGARIFSIWLSFAVWQRVFLFGIVMALGLGGFRLAKKTGNLWAQYFSGIFLIFNPFIYARLIEQPGIAAGSAAFFWFLIFLWEYLEEKGWKKMIAAGLSSGLAIAFFPHSLFFVAVALAVFLGADFFSRQDWRFSAKSLLAMLFVIFIINGNWIVGSFLSEAGGRTQAIENFTLKDAEAFATRDIGAISVYLTVLALQGYWGEYQDRFASVQDNPLWAPSWLLLLALVLVGAGKLWKKNRFVFPLIAMSALAFVLAVGVASPFFKPLIVWLYQNVPFYIGLREPQKWVAVLLFAYAYLGSWGVKYFLESRQVKKYQNALGICCLSLPIIFSFSMLGGTHAQLAPRQFPAEWQAAKISVDNLKAEKILVFPWHAYLKLDFADKNVASPARSYFGEKIIKANNTEFGGIYSHSQDAETLVIERYVERSDNPAKNIRYADFASDMRAQGIGAVMLLKAEDWQNYLWLESMGAQKMMENDNWIIYNLL